MVKKTLLLFLMATPAFAAFAPVNGLHLYYEVHGEGPPLVLIHGGGSTIESNWSRLLPIFAKKRKVIAIEEQGHGHTVAIHRPFTFENSADDIAALLDYLKIEKADVMGFSNGGSDKDVITVEHATKMKELLPQGRLAVLPASHGSYLGEVMTNDPKSRMHEVTAIIVDEFLE